MSGAGVSSSLGGPTWGALRDAVAMVFVRSRGRLDSPRAPHEVVCDYGFPGSLLSRSAPSQPASGPGVDTSLKGNFSLTPYCSDPQLVLLALGTLNSDPASCSRGRWP